jgi:hypothetical protein
MDQGGRLKGLAWRFPGHFIGRQAAQLRVNQRQQLLRSLTIPALNPLKDLGDVTHSGVTVETVHTFGAGLKALPTGALGALHIKLKPLGALAWVRRGIECLRNHADGSPHAKLIALLRPVSRRSASLRVFA